MTKSTQKTPETSKCTLEKNSDTGKYTQQKPDTIRAMFSTIADNYDKTNQVISLRLHQRWNQQLIDAVAPKGTEYSSLLDLCAGTGEVGFSWLQKQIGPKKAILLDFCQEMLDVAKKKAQNRNFSKHSIDYLQADAQFIPLPDESVDFATIAYGIRNVKEPRLCAHEVFRVLKPGGRFGILELTEPKNPFLRFAHTFYTRKVMPVLGDLLTSNGDAYRYLANSVHLFIKPDELENILRLSGFKQTSRQPLMGGIAHIIIAEKN